MSSPPRPPSTLLEDVAVKLNDAADVVRPAVNAVTPWLSWGVAQATLSTVYAVESLVEVTPVATHLMYRGAASAARKTRRAAKYTKKCVAEYCYGGTTKLAPTIATVTAVAESSKIAQAVTREILPTVEKRPQMVTVEQLSEVKEETEREEKETEEKETVEKGAEGEKEAEKKEEDEAEEDEAEEEAKKDTSNEFIVQPSSSEGNLSSNGQSQAE